MKHNPKINLVDTHLFVKTFSDVFGTMFSQIYGQARAIPLQYVVPVVGAGLLIFSFWVWYNFFR